jgi:hypothetical protein
MEEDAAFQLTVWTQHAQPPPEASSHSPWPTPAELHGGLAVSHQVPTIDVSSYGEESHRAASIRRHFRVAGPTRSRTSESHSSISPIRQTPAVLDYAAGTEGTERST